MTGKLWHHFPLLSVRLSSRQSPFAVMHYPTISHNLRHQKQPNQSAWCAQFQHRKLLSILSILQPRPEFALPWPPSGIHLPLPCAASSSLLKFPFLLHNWSQHHQSSISRTISYGFRRCLWYEMKPALDTRTISLNQQDNIFFICLLCEPLSPASWSNP